MCPITPRTFSHQVASVIAVMRCRSRNAGGSSIDRRPTYDPDSSRSKSVTAVNPRSRRGTVRARSRRSSIEPDQAQLVPVPPAPSGATLAPPAPADAVARARSARERGLSARKSLVRPKPVIAEALLANAGPIDPPSLGTPRASAAGSPRASHGYALSTATPGTPTTPCESIRVSEEVESDAIELPSLSISPRMSAVGRE